MEKLYKKTSTGKLQVWHNRAINNEIHTEWGQVDGKMQTSVETIADGKNLGKSNSTTAAEQAKAEALSRWEKKVKKGYVTSLDGADRGEVSDVIEGGIFPMLAHTYEDNAGKATFPGYVQPKLDGHRCIAVVKEGKCELWSRTRKRITSMGHIVASVEKMCKLSDVTDVVLDGELYNHSYRTKFEELTGFIRREEPSLGSEQVEYHIYDIANGESFGDRSWVVNSMLSFKQPHLVAVKTNLVKNEEEMYDWFNLFTADGYEGAIFRNAGSKYVNKRSRDLLKVKEFKDGEFTIVSVDEGRGKMAGRAIFNCRAMSGADFAVKMACTQEEAARYYEQRHTLIGKKLTVKYQGLTVDSIPRFPIGMRLRQDV